jgi:hypothetical protein
MIDCRRAVDEQRQLLIRAHATDIYICFALQSLQLPALQTILILIEAAVQLDFHVSQLRFAMADE